MFEKTAPLPPAPHPSGESRATQVVKQSQRGRQKDVSGESGGGGGGQEAGASKHPPSSTERIGEPAATQTAPLLAGVIWKSCSVIGKAKYIILVIIGKLNREEGIDRPGNRVDRK